MILFILQRIPKTGDYIEIGGLRYEVVDMDGNRIDKVLVTRILKEPAD
jgi:putative hemolysin